MHCLNRGHAKSSANLREAAELWVGLTTLELRPWDTFCCWMCQIYVQIHHTSYYFLFLESYRDVGAYISWNCVWRQHKLPRMICGLKVWLPWSCPWCWRSDTLSGLELPSCKVPTISGAGSGCVQAEETQLCRAWTLISASAHQI